jgi:hypothetical protein
MKTYRSYEATGRAVNRGFKKVSFPELLAQFAS